MKIFATLRTKTIRALKSASPLHLVDKMPNIPYDIFHCEEDKAANLQKNSQRFVKRMKKEHRITLNTVLFRGHCEFSAESALEFKNTVLKSFYN